MLGFWSNLIWPSEGALQVKQTYVLHERKYVEEPIEKLKSEKDGIKVEKCM